MTLLAQVLYGMKQQAGLKEPLAVMAERLVLGARQSETTNPSKKMTPLQLRELYSLKMAALARPANVPPGD